MLNSLLKSINEYLTTIGIQYGELTITIQDGKVIDIIEKKRTRIK